MMFKFKNIIQIVIIALLLFLLTFFIFTVFPILETYNQKSNRNLKLILKVFGYLLMVYFWLYFLGVVSYRIIVKFLKPELTLRFVLSLTITFLIAFIAFNFGHFLDRDWGRISWTFRLTIAFGVIGVCLVFLDNYFQSLNKPS